MSWLYSRELAEAFSAGFCSDGEPSVPSNSTPTPRVFSSHGRTTDVLRRFPSGMTSAPLTDDHGEVLLMSFLAASRARTSALPERDPDSREPAVAFGRSLPGSLARFDHASSSWKIPQRSFLAGLDVFLETWPRWGSMQDGQCWERATLALLTSGSESGYGPKYPTPTVSDSKNHGGPSQRRRKSPPLNALAGGPLNPTWVEWLMNWPMEWTALEPSATDRFHQWLRSHGRR